MLFRVLKQAQVTFSKENKDLLFHNIPNLKSLIDLVKYNDFNISHHLISKKSWDATNKAPCTYINIYEDTQITASIFILKEGYTMPLHDHPYMNGFLKCIAGKLKIQSYTKINHSDNKSNDFYVKQEPERILDANSETTVLSHNDSNYHEITAVGDEPAAFFDILAPPYETETQTGEKRTCSFYKKEIQSDNTIRLQKISTPLDYWCDSVHYPPEYLKSDYSS